MTVIIPMEDLVSQVSRCLLSSMIDAVRVFTVNITIDPTIAG